MATARRAESDASSQRQSGISLPSWAKTAGKEAAKALVILLATALSPIGDFVESRMVEIVNPTSARVEGTVLRGGRYLRANVELDGARRDQTNSLGMYAFDEVSEGNHVLYVLQDGEPAFDLDFGVEEQTETVTLPPLDLAAAVPLPPGDGGKVTGAPNPLYVPAGDGTPGAEATIAPTAAQSPIEPSPMRPPASPEPQEQHVADGTPGAGATPAATPPATPTAGASESIGLAVETKGVPEGQRKPGYEAIGQSARVRIDASPDLLRTIDRVTYYLDPSFEPSVVTRYDSADGFALEFPVPGTFDLIARVYFQDGLSIDLAVPVEG